MELTSFKAKSDGGLDPEYWNVTFLGGAVDLDEPPVSPRQVVTPHAPGGAYLPLAMTSMGDLVWGGQIKGGQRIQHRLMDVGITSWALNS